MKQIALALLLLSMASPASAFCFRPTVPIGGAPSAPFCSLADSYNRCSSWQVENFASEVKEYIKKMQQYIYDAEKYAKCQAEEAVDNWNDFANGY